MNEEWKDQFTFLQSNSNKRILENICVEPFLTIFPYVGSSLPVLTKGFLPVFEAICGINLGQWSEYAASTVLVLKRQSPNSDMKQYHLPRFSTLVS